MMLPEPEVPAAHLIA